ncbi:MAG: hypothetical protein V3T05_03365 [Myxococcota bacterium]
MRRLRPHQRLLVPLILLGSVGFAETAYAYVLPADFIMRMLADKRRRMGIRDLSVQLTTDIDGEDDPVEDRIYMKAPERLRHIRQTENETTVLVLREGKSARGDESKLERIEGPARNLLPLLLMPLGKDLDEMQAHMVTSLGTLGIDTATVTLGRFNGVVTYVIGGADPSKSQLWIDKETFLPMRLMLPKQWSGTSGRVELRWLEFGSSATGDWFPRVLERYVDDARIERSEVAKIELNKKLPETLFDLP